MMSSRFSLFAVSRTFTLMAACVLLASSAFAQRLTTTSLADKSGTVGVAPGWKLTTGSGGAATLTGPHGALLLLGLPVPAVAEGVESQFPGVPGPLFPGSLRVDFSDPVRSYIDIVRTLGPKTGAKLIRLRAVESVPWERGRAAYVRASATMKGVRTEVFGLYAVMPVNTAQGLFYYSEASAPTADFQRLYPTMMAMWKSWSVNPKTLRNRLDSAAKALAEVDFAGTLDSVMAARRAAAEHAAAQFDSYIRQ
jgi:hypothetical protein